MEIFVDRGAGMPIRHQIRGTIEFAISSGALSVGEALPSVRELAEKLGVAPMTVNQAYGDLKKDGLIEARAGAGTFVAFSARSQEAENPSSTSLHAEIDQLVDRARKAGISLRDLGLMIQARLAFLSSNAVKPRIVVVGGFRTSTEDYAARIAAQIGSNFTVEAVAISELERDPSLRQRHAGADVVVTFLTMRRRLLELMPTAEIVTIRFIPSEETRRSLASLSPQSRLGGIARVTPFLPVLSSGLKRFASHCHDIRLALEDGPDLAQRMADRSVIIYATGSEGVLPLMPAQATKIEFRHIPDPGDVERLVETLVQRS
ncbi:MAG: GntR family transcriptional regulator [Devosia sp.]|uniref:GntR family transcriptional regulator n=1 Tax=Devosia sp. TaxID=1871048 RepID=UPI0033949ABD